MAKEISGNLIGSGKRFALVVSRFNEFLSKKLLEGAVDCLERHGVAEGDIEAYWVPGSFEIPVTALNLAKTGKFQAVVCLGAVIRGATPHFDYVAAEVSKGVAQASMTTGIPVLFGVITADTLEQAIERAGTKAGNKGATAAEAAIEMANLFAGL
ncbi:MAG: 6,7-dimethyl-8-ribityllumazine synthase [Planctomycetota bacterium]|jgi:6,7-dimethyl-8-ribityllumazine synthase